MALTGGAGVDVAIEAVGIPATFDICQAIWRRAGVIANVGVHGKPVALAPRDALVAEHHADDAAGGHGHDADAPQGRAVAAASSRRSS